MLLPPYPHPHPHPRPSHHPNPHPSQVPQSIRDKLPLWKPNSALIVVDFAVRHGFVSPDEPGFVEIIHLLRAGGFGSE